MAMLNGRNSSGFQSDINITPLVDVVLVLLIIFMVVSPQAQRWYEVHLARQKASSILESQPLPSVTLSIQSEDCPFNSGFEDRAASAECRVRVNEDKITLADLGRTVEDLYRERRGSDRVLFIAVEERFNYEAAMRIIDIARTGVQDLKIGIVLAGDRPFGES
jgi:biopolymer transport protein TolR